MAIGALSPTARPSIVIVSPPSGAVLRGTTLTVRVHVRNFRLVPPNLTNPPVLPAGQGHILYALDSLRNVVPDRDLSAAPVHTWHNVAPGRHLVLAYLVTSQNVPYPGVAPARRQVVLRPFSPGVAHAPQTGGAEMTAPWALLLGFLCVGLGLIGFVLTVLLDRSYRGEAEREIR